MKLALIQMVSSHIVADNLVEADRLLQNAADHGAELAVLPEYFCLMGQHDSDKLLIAEDFGVGPLQSYLAERARTLGLWLVAGTLPICAASKDRVCNSSLVFNPDGECVARYDKIHLFRFDNGTEAYDEARVLQRGERPVHFDLPSRDGHTWRVGLSVCYDLRFPELYRAYAKQGADLLLAPSAFTHTTGQAHWEILLRARAIENLAFMAAAAQGGAHSNGRRTWGQSMAVGPWGDVLAQLPIGPGVLNTELLPECLPLRRGQLPSLQHRVLDN